MKIVHFGRLQYRSSRERALSYALIMGYALAIWFILGHRKIPAGWRSLLVAIPIGLAAVLLHVNTLYRLGRVTIDPAARESS